MLQVRNTAMESFRDKSTELGSLELCSDLKMNGFPHPGLKLSLSVVF